MGQKKALTDSVDFKAVVEQLREQGWTQREMAAFSGLSHGRIARLALDPKTQPKYNHGSALLALLTPYSHIQLTGYARQYHAKPLKMPQTG